MKMRAKFLENEVFIMDNKKLQIAAEFFRRNRAFNACLNNLFKIIKVFGRLGGTAKLTKLTQEEKEALGVLLVQDYIKQSSLTISVKKFSKALEKTRFSNVDLKELLFAYKGENILTRAEELEEYNRAKEKFFLELLAEFPEKNCQMWLKYIQANKPGSRGVHNTYNENPLLLKEQLKNILSAICKLPIKIGNNPTKYYRLPVFANLVTGDPHAFDLNTPQGRLLIFALGFIRTLEDTEYNFSINSNSEEITELLSNFGIIRDDILNFVTCAGIVAYEKGTTESIAWWQECAKEG